MTKQEQFFEHLREAARALERAIDLLDDVDPGEALGSREYLLGRLELVADALEAHLPETINAMAQKALQEVLGAEV
jgi:hypothetical protein